MGRNFKTSDTDQRGAISGRTTMRQPNGSSIGQAPYVPTDDERQLVKEWSCVKGQRWTAIQLGISLDTLQRHFRDEIQIAKANACAQIGASLFEKAIAGDGASQRFFLVTQGGGEWSPKVKHEHSGPDGQAIRTLDLSGFLAGKSEHELAAIENVLGELAAAGGLVVPGSTDGSDPSGPGAEAEA